MVDGVESGRKIKEASCRPLTTDALVWLRVPERILYKVAVLSQKVFMVQLHVIWERQHVLLADEPFTHLCPTFDHR